MSQVLEQFKLSARAKNWAAAVQSCNILNMPEMLQGLDFLLGQSLLDEFAAQLPTVGAAYGLERMNWAVAVVRTRRIPGGAAPGDLLQTGQVQDARNFLARARPPAPARRKRLKVTLFWTEAARGESVSSSLVQKAQDLLKTNGDKFVLDIDYRRNEIPFKPTVDFEIDGCDDSGIQKIRELVAQSGVCPSDRLAVIFCMPFQTMNVENRTHGMQCTLPTGGRCVLVNVSSVAADRGTLLHEVGHGAGIEHDFSDSSNIMSYGASRTRINPIQLNKFDKAFFCSL